MALGCGSAADKADGSVLDGGVDSDAPAGVPDAPGPGEAGERACLARANARCQLAARCFESFELQRRHRSEADCLALEQFTCRERLHAPGTSDTPASVEACAAVLAALSCEDHASGLPPAACEPRPGALPDGTRCLADAQCQSSYCNLTRPNPCGVCGRRKRLDEVCWGSQIPCERGLVCVTRPGEPPGQSGCPATVNCTYCLPQVPEGGACTPFRGECAPGLACVASVCRPRVRQLGAPCAGGGQPPGPCDEQAALFCGADGRCARTRLLELTEYCGSGYGPGGFERACRAPGWCPGTGENPFGSCIELPGDGSPCRGEFSPDQLCLAPAVCAYESARVCRIATAAACAP